MTALACGLFAYFITQQLIGPQHDLTVPSRIEQTYPTPDLPQAIILEKQSQELQKIVDDFVNTYPANFGIVVKNFETGVEAIHNSGEVFTSASLYKLFAAHQLYRAIDQGLIAQGSYEYCIGLAIELSDNPCGVTLQQAATSLGMQADLPSQGLLSTNFTGLYPTTTAADVAFLLDKIYHQTSLTKESQEQLLEHLLNQQVSNRLPQGLPVGTSIAHKTGDIAGFVHDGGIVYGPNGDYMIVILSGPWPGVGVPNNNAYVAFADLSSQVYNFFL